MMVIKVRITFYATSNGYRSWSVPGMEVPFSALTVDDLTRRVKETEEYLSRITGLNVKIETESGDKTVMDSLSLIRRVDE